MKYKTGHKSRITNSVTIQSVESVYYIGSIKPSLFRDVTHRRLIVTWVRRFKTSLTN